MVNKQKLSFRNVMTSIALVSSLTFAPMAIYANSDTENKEPVTTENNEVESNVNAPDIIGTSGISVDYYSGEVLYAKNEDEQVYPASITKVLTAMLVLENLEMNDKITFSSRAVGEDPSNQQLLFKEGEEVTVSDALHALMIISANDAAIALAEAVSGSVDEFAKLMNEKAKELGATNSSFKTPNGLPNPEHYTTASDYAKIVKGAMEYPEVLDLMGTRSASIKTNEREVEIKSPNTIPKSNPNSLGGKTGYTDSAQHTLVEVLEKDDRRVITITFHSTKDGKYEDMNTMSDYAFSLYNVTKLYSANELFQIVEFNDVEYSLKVQDNVVLKYAPGEDTEYVQSVQWDKSNGVHKAGEPVAHLVISKKGEVLSSTPLYTDKDFEYTVVKGSQNKTSNHGDEGKDSKSLVITWIAAIFLIPLLVFATLVLITRKKQ